ncbi:MAG: hypothetical protein AAFO07_16555 [Bacteroidota bacterium]
MNIRYLIAYLLILLPLLSMAQDEEEYVEYSDPYLEEGVQPTNFDEATWKELTNGVDFTEEAVKKKKKSTQNVPDDEATFDDYESSPSNPGISFTQGSVLMRILLIILAIVVLLLLLRALLGNELGFRNKKIKKDKKEFVSLEEIEENIEEADIFHYINQAKEAGNYSLAVRLYYLETLKQLSLSNTIKWKKDKTNLDYIREMNGSDLYESFRYITNIFENVWYGDRKLEKDSFVEIEKSFTTFLDSVQGAVLS